MKAVWIALSFLLAAGVANADGMVQFPSSDEVEAAPAPRKAAARPYRHKTVHKAMRYPQGDLRHCLELQRREDIYRCVETEPNR